MTEPLRLCLQRIDASGSMIVIVAREEGTKERWTVQVPFRPYFYVPEEEADTASLLKAVTEVEPGHLSIDGVQVAKIYVSSPNMVSRYRGKFSRTWEADVPYVRRFMVDLRIKNGFVVHRYQELAGTVILAEPEDIEADDIEVPPRVFRYDIETNKHEDEFSGPLEAKGAITSIVIWDTYERDVVHHIQWNPSFGVIGDPRHEKRSRHVDDLACYACGGNGWGTKLPPGPDCASCGGKGGRLVAWNLTTYGSEEEMLLAWIKILKERRPDILSAWNGHHGFHRRNWGGYDAPYLITRLDRVKIGSSQMSPMNSARCGYHKAKKKDERGKWFCTIDGVQLFDMMPTYQVKDGGFTGNVKGSSLKYVAEQKLGVKMKKDPAGIEDWWRYDNEEFLWYAFRDVAILTALEEKEDFLGFARTLQRFSGVEDLDIILRPGTQTATMELRAALDLEHPRPTARGDEYEKVEIEGGEVLDPDFPGLHDFVGVVDLNTMYVTIIQSCNISYETWIPREEACEPCECSYGGKTWEEIRAIKKAEASCPDCKGRGERMLGDYIVIPTDMGYQYFRKDIRGISPIVLDELVKIRKSYDIKIKAAGSPAEVDRLKKERTPAKSLVLTEYGFMLNEYNPLHRPQCGSAVTGAGRHIILHMAGLVRDKLGVKLARGDTDSVLPIVPPNEEDPVEFGLWLEELCNASFDKIAKDFNLDQHNFGIGLERMFNPFIHGTQSKMYAGFVYWDEGSLVEDHLSGEPVIKGLPGIKSDAAPITARLTKDVVKRALLKEDPQSIGDSIRQEYERVKKGEAPITDVVKSVTLNFPVDSPRDDLYTVVAAKNGHLAYGYDYQVGSRIRVFRVKSKRMRWIAIPEGEDIPEDLNIDWDYHAKGTVLSPLRGFMSWIGIEQLAASILRGSRKTAQQKLT